ncbi:TonB-dependent receptor [Constantimarinum furrinae]|nr:carboxypeptidase-like regulatory domain-containing protein [Constantimarinum furrinae]
MHLKTNNFRLVFITLLFVFSLQNIHGQNTEKKALLSIMTDLESKHNVRFSYATQDVSQISIVPPEESLNLNESLQYLNNITPLIFTEIDNRYITVVRKNNISKYCGRIINSETGDPMEGANIVSQNSRFSTISNSEGYFYLPQSAAGTNFTVSHVGFEQQTLLVDELRSDCLSIMMLPAVDMLEQVYIRALFVKGIDKNTDGALTLSADSFGLLPGQTDNDVLLIAQSLPGVESVDETVSHINIRGGTRDENLILWDNIKMYQSGHFFGLISAYNPDLTKNVTIYKNGSPAKYGEGVSGVIDMRSTNTIAETFRGGAGLNLINTNLFFEIPLSKTMGLQTSARTSINTVLETPVYKTYSERIFQDTEITSVDSSNSTALVSADEDFKFYDFSTKFLWDFSEKDKVRLNFLTMQNSLDFTETINETQSSQTSKLDQNTLVAGASWDRKWDEGIKTSFLGYGSYYLLESINRDIFTTQEQFQENEVLETGIKLDSELQISDRNTIKAGYHFSETGISNTQQVNLPRFLSKDKDVLRSHIIYGGIAYRPSGNNNSVINAGFRVNYFSKFKETFIEPRLSIHQEVGSGFAIEGLGEFKSQTTTQRIDFESDFLGVEKRRWVLVNNDDIPIIKSKQGSVGMVYAKDNWFANAEGFYKSVDGITAASQGFQNQFQFTRDTGGYHVKGVEFSVNRRTPRFSAWLSYLYMINDYEFSNLEPNIFPNNLDIRHTATVAGSYNFKNFKIALGFNYHTGKPNTFPLNGAEIIEVNGEEVIQYDSPNAERLSSYFRTDISAEYIWELSDKVDAKINLAVLNIADTDNTLNIRYVLTTDENGATRVNQVKEVSLGLTPNFAVQVLF